MDGWDLGPADPLQWICREWVQELGFDETTINVEVRDDRVGAKNTELDGLTIRGKELLVQGYEFPSGLFHQEHDGGICAPTPKEQNLAPLPYVRFISSDKEFFPLDCESIQLCILSSYLIISNLCINRCLIKAQLLDLLFTNSL